MKALVLADKNQSLTLQEIPNPKPGTGDAIVKIHAAALNHRDVWIQKGQYAGLKFPLVPGSDGAGVVEAVGNNGQAHWLGKEVIINPSLHWGEELSHQHPKEFKILGLPDDGTFAEFVKIPVGNLVERPKHLSFKEAAALPLAGLTAYRALFTRGGLQPQEKVLITGIGGGVALFALQFAVAANANVYVSSGHEEKISKALTLGSLMGVNYAHEHWVEQLQEQAGSFDLIVDGAGGDDVGHLLNLAAPGGRIVFYGATRGNPANVEIRRIFWKQLNVLGSTMGSPSDFQSMIDFVNKHQIRPVIDQVFSFEDGEDAMKKMDHGKQFGKIVININ